jgi:hypothetical protein
VTTTDPLEQLLRNAESAPVGVAEWLVALRDQGEAADDNDKTDFSTR